MITPEPSFDVEGFLVAADDRAIRLVMPPYVLDFARDAVCEIQERPSLPTQDTSVGIAVRVTLRTGAGVLGMSSADDIEARLWRTRRPFAMLTRPSTPPSNDDGTYAELEQRFLASHGIEVNR